ncbi:uncharacterized protein LOC143357477 [Halictus rubicundus]|uniref:uncharacterized protein LOC143357477 n=1 Tax=Halictus rubicundus TaxID=77578 RepID=UPI004036BA70
MAHRVLFLSPHENKKASLPARCCCCCCCCFTVDQKKPNRRPEIQGVFDPSGKRETECLSLSLSPSCVCCLPLCYPQRSEPKEDGDHSAPIILFKVQPSTQQLLLPGPSASRIMIQGTAEAREQTEGHRPHRV